MKERKTRKRRNRREAYAFLYGYVLGLTNDAMPEVVEDAFQILLEQITRRSE